MTKSESDSLTQKCAGVTVDASPFNGIKLEMVLSLVILAVVWLLVERYITDILDQLMLIGGAALVGMSWLLVRTHRVLRRLQQVQRGAHGGQEQE